MEVHVWELLYGMKELTKFYMIFNEKKKEALRDGARRGEKMRQRFLFVEKSR